MVRDVSGYAWGDERWMAERRQQGGWLDQPMSIYEVHLGGWLRVPENYAHVRTMFQQGRIAILKGNMLTDKALPSIAASARALNVPIRIYYPSNAEEQWTLPEQYRQNVIGLPFDDKGLVLRTLFSKNWTNVKEKSYWHYIVQGGFQNQELMRQDGYDRTPKFMEFRRKTDHENLSIIGLPGPTELEAFPAPTK